MAHIRDTGPQACLFRMNPSFQHFQISPAVQSLCNSQIKINKLINYVIIFPVLNERVFHALASESICCNSFNIVVKDGAIALFLIGRRIVSPGRAYEDKSIVHRRTDSGFGDTSTQPDRSPVGYGADWLGQIRWSRRFASANLGTSTKRTG